MKQMLLLVVVWLVATSSNFSAAEAQEAKQAKKSKQTNQAQNKPKKASPMDKVEDDPKLPRVLLIGDSISIGYTLPVRKLLEGKANVHRPQTNCGPSTKGVAELEKWLGKKDWDVIHFNFGLHDLKYMGPNGENLADPKGETSAQQVPPGEYEENLRKIVERLQQTKAKLIWRNTTPVPEGAKGRVVGDSKKYNEIAAKVMQEADIPTDDQYTYCMEHPEFQRKANVHFTPEGSQGLGQQAANAILEALK
ncbi:MAG: SGNH/GDSL hydrolase family protein [Planctomycetota bacterium]